MGAALIALALALLAAAPDCRIYLLNESDGPTMVEVATRGVRHGHIVEAQGFVVEPIPCDWPHPILVRVLHITEPNPTPLGKSFPTPYDGHPAAWCWGDESRCETRLRKLGEQSLIGGKP